MAVFLFLPVLGDGVGSGDGEGKGELDGFAFNFVPSLASANLTHASH